MVAAVVISSTVAFLVMDLTYRCLGITMLLDVENLKMAFEARGQQVVAVLEHLRLSLNVYFSLQTCQKKLTAKVLLGYCGKVRHF